MLHSCALIAFVLSLTQAHALPPSQRPLAELMPEDATPPSCGPNAVADVFGDLRHYSQATAYCNAVVAQTTTITTHLPASLAAVPTPTTYPAVATPPVPSPADGFEFDVVQSACSCLVPAATVTFTVTRYDATATPLTTPKPKAKLANILPSYGRGAEPVPWFDIHDGLDIGGRL